MIFYINKKEMLTQWHKDYFGLTVHYPDRESDIYIRSDLPECVQKSVLAHEEYHAKGKHDEFGAWVAGFKGNWKGFFLGILLSLRPSRLKMYPELVSGFILFCAFVSLLIWG